MPNLESPENIFLVLGFLAPGFVALFIRKQFLTGRIPPQSEMVLSSLILSVIYHTLVLPLIDWGLAIQKPGYGKPLILIALVFVGPALFGLILGLNAQKGWLRKWVSRFGLSPVHPVPTAWDWKFQNIQQEQWVLVTLKDGTVYAGHLGSGSFMSSDPNERDLYIQRIYNIGDDNIWSPIGERGVWIASGEIRAIEIWPVT